MKIKANVIWKIYYLIIFTTELISFEFIGNLRLYYIVSLFYFFPFIRQGKKLVKNKVTNSLFLFISVLLFISLFSSSIGGSLSGVISLSLNIITAFVTYFVLCNKKLSLNDLFNTLEKIMLFCMIFGLITWVLSKFGINITLNKINSFQILNDQIAAFRTEANTHGKLCCYAVAYCIPFLTFKKMNRRRWFITITAIATLLISPTRSATYAVILATGIFFAILIKRGKGNRIIKIFALAIVMIAAVPILMQSGLISTTGYSFSKLNNFFVTFSEAKNDYSGSFRIESLYAAIDIWTSNLKTIIMGVGYNQAKVSLQGGKVDTVAAGTQIVGLLVSGGVLSIFAWISVIITTAKKVVRVSANDNPITYAMLVCFFYIIIIEFISADFFVPETWITFGVIAFLQGGDYFYEN